jgi:hypothetical protein
MTLPTFRTGPLGPATHIFAITPHDTNALPAVAKKIRANTNGNVVLRALESGADVTLAVTAGQEIDAIVTHVRATGTTATVHGFA